MGQEYMGLNTPVGTASSNVGQQMGRYQDGTAPQIGADPKAKAAPAVPGADLAGLSGLPGPDAASPGKMNPQFIMALMQALKGRR